MCPDAHTSACLFLHPRDENLGLFLTWSPRYVCCGGKFGLSRCWFRTSFFKIKRSWRFEEMYSSALWNHFGDGQEHHQKGKDALRCCPKKKRAYVDLGSMARDDTYRESQLVHEWYAWARYLDHLEKIDISHTAPHLQRNITTIYFSCGVSTKIKQASPPQRRPGYQDAKKAFVDTHKQGRQDCRVTFITKS